MALSQLPSVFGEGLIYQLAPLAVKKSNWPVSNVTDGRFEQSPNFPPFPNVGLTIQSAQSETRYFIHFSQMCCLIP